jgi:hypothetical protein
VSLNVQRLRHSDLPLEKLNLAQSLKESNISSAIGKSWRGRLAEVTFTRLDRSGRAK